MRRTDLWAGGPVWVAIISTKRPTAPIAYTETIGEATWYVSPGEGEMYKRNGAADVREVTGLSAARNAALDDGFALGLPVLEMSDDLRKIVYATEREDSTDSLKRYKRVPGTLADLVTDLANNAVRLGAKLAGVAPTSSLLQYGGEAHGTRTRNFILGDCILVWPNDCRFDTNLRLKEDYDYTAQMLNTVGKVCRREKWLLEYRHWTNAGGAVDIRTLDREQEMIAYLRNKWGPEVFADHPTRVGDVQFRWPLHGKPSALLGVKYVSLWGDELPASAPKVDKAAVKAKLAARQPRVLKDVGPSLPVRNGFCWPNGLQPQHNERLLDSDGTAYALKQVAIESEQAVIWVVPYEQRDDWNVEWTKFSPAALRTTRRMEQSA